MKMGVGAKSLDASKHKDAGYSLPETLTRDEIVEEPALPMIGLAEIDKQQAAAGCGAGHGRWTTSGPGRSGSN